MTTENTASDTPWGPLSLDTGETLELRIGTLVLWGQRDGDDWLFAVDREAEPCKTLALRHDAQPPDDIAWQRWNGESSDVLALEPALPDRPVIVRPDEPLFILPGASVELFISVALWVGVVRPAEPRTVLLEEPAQVLSRSWFGTPQEGELCYALRSPARRRPDAVEPQPYRALCAVSLTNASDELLPFERLCLYVQHLSLHEADGVLWTNDASVSYRGAEKWSAVKYGAAPPHAAGPATFVAGPRETPDPGLSLKSLAARARQMTGFVS